MALNIAAITTITGLTAMHTNSSTTIYELVATPSANTLHKLNSLYIANTTTLLTADVYITRSSVLQYLCKALSIAANTTAVLITKDASIYMMPGDVLNVVGSATGLVFTVSYETLV